MLSSPSLPPLLHQDLNSLTEIGHALGLDSEQPERTRELLLELLHDPRCSDLTTLLTTLGMFLGHYFKSLELSRSELSKALRHYTLLLPLDAESCLLLKADERGRVWQHLWQHGKHQVSPYQRRQVQDLMGAEPRSWLALESDPMPHQPRRKPFQRLMEFLSLERRNLLLIFFYALAIGLLSLAVPLASQSLVNTVSFGALREPLLVLCLLLFLTFAFLALMRSLQVILIEILQRRIFVRVTQDTARRLLRIQLQAFEQSRLPELVNRFFDVVTVQKSASFLLLDGLAILLSTLTGMGLLAFYHPLLLVFDILLLGAIVLNVVVLGIGGQRSSIQESSQKYAIAAWLEELAVHPQLFKATAGGGYAAARTENLLHGYLKARKRHFRVVLRQNIGAFTLQGLAITALLGLGGWLVIEGQLTIGQWVAAELVVANVVNSFAKVGKHLETWYDLMAAFDKLGYLFDLPQESLEYALLPRTDQPATLKLEGVSYRATQGDKALEALELDCPAGARMAILGTNTWESNTLLDLIYGARQPAQGLMLVDGLPLHQLLLPEYRSQVVMVRDLELITGSLLDNLRLGHQELSRQEAREVLEQVGLWERVQHLPEVLDTQLSASGFPLSPSEAHCLMIARALAMQPRLLVLDGVLDQITWQAEDPLSQWLFSEPLRRRTTLLIVTNKTGLLSHCEQVYVFNAQGQLQPAELGEETSR